MLGDSHLETRQVKERLISAEIREFHAHTLYLEVTKMTPWDFRDKYYEPIDGGSSSSRERKRARERESSDSFVLSPEPRILFVDPPQQKQEERHIMIESHLKKANGAGRMVPLGAFFDTRKHNSATLTHELCLCHNW
jgi:hypothetical protein